MFASYIVSPVEFSIKIVWIPTIYLMQLLRAWAECTVEYLLDVRKPQ
jgi:hypothetical protein